MASLRILGWRPFGFELGERFCCEIPRFAQNDNGEDVQNDRVTRGRDARLTELWGNDRVLN